MGAAALISGLEVAAALLAAHRPADPTEAEALALARRLAAAGAWRRTDAAPGHLTASALVLSPDRERVLLIEHRAFGAWIQPGGHLDGPAEGPPESPLATALRELAEEAGVVDVEPLYDGLLDVERYAVAPRPARGEPAHLHLDLRFALRARAWELRAGSDAKAARWCPRSMEGDPKLDQGVARGLARLRARG